MIPAGPLREPATRLADVDVIVSNLSAGETAPAITATRARHVIMQLRPVELEQLSSGRRVSWDAWIASHGGETHAAVAAIGRPERYFSMLRNAGLELVRTAALPDHYAYAGASPFATLDTRYILVTAKDAVKCERFHDDRVWVCLLYTSDAADE